MSIPSVSNVQTNPLKQLPKHLIPHLVSFNDVEDRKILACVDRSMNAVVIETYKGEAAQIRSDEEMDLFEKECKLTKISKDLFMIGADEPALHFLRNLELMDDNQSMENMARRLALSGRVAQALRLVDHIHDPNDPDYSLFYRDDAFAEISLALNETSRFDIAFEAANHIQNGTLRENIRENISTCDLFYQLPQL